MNERLPWIMVPEQESLSCQGRYSNSMVAGGQDIRNIKRVDHILIHTQESDINKR